MGGGASFAIGLTLWFMFLGAGAAAGAKQGDFTLYLLAGLPLILVIGGVIAAGLGLGIGWRYALSDDTTDQIREFPGCYIIALLILDHKSEKVFDVDLHSPDDVFWYAQVRQSDGNCRELRLDPNLYATLGEGMQGTASIQGKWLVAFAPTRPV